MCWIVDTMDHWLDQLTGWEDFYRAFSESQLLWKFPDEDIYTAWRYSEESFPYIEYTKQNGPVEHEVIKKLLKKGFPAQEGLDGFLSTIIETNEYMRPGFLTSGYKESDILKKENPTIKMFIRNGAVMNYDILFKSYTEYANTMGLGPVYQYTEMCAKLIDLTHRYGLNKQIHKYVDSVSTPAVNWPNIVGRYSNPTIEKQYLQYASVYLSTRNTIKKSYCLPILCC